MPTISPAAQLAHQVTAFTTSTTKVLEQLQSLHNTGSWTRSNITDRLATLLKDASASHATLHDALAIDGLPQTTYDAIAGVLAKRNKVLEGITNLTVTSEVRGPYSRQSTAYYVKSAGVTPIVAQVADSVDDFGKALALARGVTEAAV